MEIPVISLENCLQNLSLISRVFSVSSIHEILQICSIWTWGALIFAFLATFTSFIKRTKVVIFRLWRCKPVTSQHSLLHSFSDYDDEDDDEDSCSSSSESDEEEEEEEEEEEDEEEEESTWQDSRVAGRGNNGGLKSRQFSWTDFVNGKGVVKSWDGLGLGFGSSSGNLLSLWDLTDLTNSFSGGNFQFPAVSMPSPSVMVTARFENSKNVALRMWDTRASRQIPEIFAELQPRQRKGVAIGGSSTPVVVRDIRNIETPLEDLTEDDLKTWWDADAVMVDGDNFTWDGCGSVVSRCSNAVLSCFNLDKMGNSS